MKRILNILAALVVWCAATLYFVQAVRVERAMTDTLTVRGMEIIVADSARTTLITGSAVRGWIDSAGLDPSGRPLKTVPVAAIDSLVTARDFVREADVWTDLNGTVTVRLTQREPLFRIAGGRGYDLYVTRDGTVLPAGAGTAQYVPVVTGDVSLPPQPGRSKAKTEKNASPDMQFMDKLINFVSYITDDPFWNAMTVQIDVRRTPDGSGRRELVLVPRAGDCLVLLGEPDGCIARLERLRAFFRTQTCRRSLGRWRTIDLRYDNQIVCTNNI